MYTRWQQKSHLYLHVVSFTEGERYMGWVVKVRYISIFFFFFCFYEQVDNKCYTHCLSFCSRPSRASLAGFVSLIQGRGRREGGSTVQSSQLLLPLFFLFQSYIYILFFFEGINIISVTLIIFFCIYHVNHTGLYHNYVHTLVSSLASVKEAADRQANHVRKTHVLTLLHAHMGRTHAQPLPHSTATLARRHDSSWTTFVDQLN